MDTTDISSQIGALELDDHLESYGDCALEAMAGGLPTDMGRPGCPPIQSIQSICGPRHIDGVLEAAGANNSVGPTGVPGKVCPPW